MKYQQILIALFVLCISACKKNNSAHAVDPNIKVYISLYTDSITGANNLMFFSTTSTDYTCINYTLNNVVTTNNDKISIAFTGVSKPANCINTSGPARGYSYIGMLANGIYPVSVANGSQVSSGMLTVSDSSYSVSFTSLNGINAPSQTILKLPVNTIWGVVQYAAGPYKNPLAVSNILDSIAHYGGQPFTGSYGNYAYFTFDSSGVNNVLPKAYGQSFAFYYSGDINDLKAFIYRLSANSDSLDIMLYTPFGQTFKNY